MPLGAHFGTAGKGPGWNDDTPEMPLWSRLFISVMVRFKRKRAKRGVIVPQEPRHIARLARIPSFAKNARSG
jgi:hypothetical protein